MNDATDETTLEETENQEKQSRERDTREKETRENLPLEKPKLICSARLILTFACLLATFNISCARIGLPIAMVCMMKPQTDPHDSKTGGFTWSSSVRGYLMSAVFYGFIVGPFVAGYLSFKYGGKLILIVSSVSAGTTNFLLPVGALTSPVLFFCIRVFTGFFASFAFPAFYDLMGHWAPPEERQLLIGGALIGIPLASILNFPVNTFICEKCGWSWIFYISGMWTVSCGLLYVFITYNYPEKCPYITAKELRYLNARIPKPGNLAIPWKRIVESLPIYAYIVMHFSMNYVYLSLIMSLPLLMEEVYQLSLEENGLLSATPFIGSFIMRILISLFFEKLRKKLSLSKNVLRKIFVSVGAIFVSAFLITVTFLSLPYKYWALGCFVGASCALELCITAGYLLSVMDMCPSYVNVVTGIANSIGNTAGLICPVVTGWITTHGTKDEWNIVFYVTISVLLVSTIFYLIFGRNHLLYWGLASLPVESQLPRASIVN